MTPEEEMQQRAQLQAMALRGQDPTAITQEADALSGVGGALAGLGGRSVRAMSQDLVGRGDALRDLLKIRSPLAKSPEELENLRSLAEHRRALDANMGKTKPAKDTSFQDATGMRKELTALPETKALVDTEANYHQLVNAADDPTGDVARIYALAKIFDPGGRVTEGDYQAAKQGQGPMARFQAYINEVEGQGFLSPSTRANMRATAEMLYKKRQADYSSAAGKFSTIAKKRGLDPEDVVIRAPAGAAQPGGFDLGGKSSLPTDKAARLQELRRKKAAGELK